jgi:hypothetical protein
VFIQLKCVKNFNTDRREAVWSETFVAVHKIVAFGRDTTVREDNGELPHTRIWDGTSTPWRSAETVAEFQKRLMVAIGEE